MGRTMGLHNAPHYSGVRFVTLAPLASAPALADKTSPLGTKISTGDFLSPRALRVRAQNYPTKKPPLNGRFFSGANDGARTHDNRYHKPGLCQLSYVRHFFGVLQRI